jgi:hypothetical protein
MLLGLSVGREGRAEAFDFIPNPFGAPGAEPPADNPLRKQLEEMSRRMDEMRKSIEDLRKQRLRSDPPEKKRDQI